MIIKYNYLKVYHMDLDEILQKQAYILMYQKKSVKVAWIDGIHLISSCEFRAH